MYRRTDEDEHNIESAWNWAHDKHVKNLHSHGNIAHYIPFFFVCHATDLYKSICLVRASVSAQFLHVSVSLMWNSLANLQNEVMLLELTFYFVWMRVCAFLKPIFLHSFHTRTEFICRRCDHIVFICIFFFYFNFFFCSVYFWMATLTYLFPLCCFTLVLDLYSKFICTKVSILMA